VVSISFFFKAIVLADAGGSQDYLKLLEFGRDIQPPADVRQLRYERDGKRPKEGFHSKILQGQVNDEHGSMRTDITSFTSENIFPSVWKYISKNMEIYFQRHGNTRSLKFSSFTSRKDILCRWEYRQSGNTWMAEM